MEELPSWEVTGRAGMNGSWWELKHRILPLLPSRLFSVFLANILCAQSISRINEFPELDEPLSKLIAPEDVPGAPLICSRTSWSEGQGRLDHDIGCFLECLMLLGVWVSVHTARTQQSP